MGGTGKGQTSLSSSSSHGAGGLLLAAKCIRRVSPAAGGFHPAMPSPYQPSIRPLARVAEIKHDGFGVAAGILFSGTPFPGFALVVAPLALRQT
jgi:hypothetical protein